MALAAVALGSAYLFTTRLAWRHQPGAYYAPVMLVVGYVLRRSAGVALSLLGLISGIGGGVLVGLSLGLWLQTRNGAREAPFRLVLGSGMALGLLAGAGLLFTRAAPDQAGASSTERAPNFASPSPTVPKSPPQVVVSPPNLEPPGPRFADAGRDALAIAVDSSGVAVATLHEKGVLRLWQRRTQNNAAVRQIGPGVLTFVVERRTDLAGAKWLRFVPGAVVIGNDSSIESHASDDLRLIRKTELCPMTGPVSVSVIGGVLMTGSSKLCSLAVQIWGEPEVVALGPECERVVGLDAPPNGFELAVQCPRRIVVFDTISRKRKYSLGVPPLVPGSVQLARQRVLALAQTPEGYEVDVFSLSGASATPVMRIPVGAHVRAPQLFYDARYMAFVLSGDGICRHGTSNGARRDCMVDATIDVEAVAFPAEWRRIPDDNSASYPAMLRAQIAPGIALIGSGDARKLREVF